jgi:hypothetical protein
MSQPARNHPALDTCPSGVCTPGPSESASAIEHQAALDATLFRRNDEPSELVLELEAGQLRLRRRCD